MSRKAPSNLDVRLGSPVLPASITRITTDHRGALAVHVDSTQHDLELLAAVGAAIRDEGREVADLLVKFAEFREQADRAELDGNAALKHSLLDESVDALADIECAMTDVEVGAPVVGSLRPAETSTLVEALAPEAVAA